MSCRCASFAGFGAACCALHAWQGGWPTYLEWPQISRTRASALFAWLEMGGALQGSTYARTRGSRATLEKKPPTNHSGDKPLPPNLKLGNYSLRIRSLMVAFTPVGNICERSARTANFALRIQIAKSLMSLHRLCVTMENSS